MNTEPVRRAIGNLFPTCWRGCISPQHNGYTMSRIAKEDKMDWGVPFLSDAFVECANLLMETIENKRFLFVPLWKEEHGISLRTDQENQIPDADKNTADSVWLFTGNPIIDNAAFAHTAGPGSVPPYESRAVSEDHRNQTEKRPAVIICPGGAYEMLSMYSEGIQLAQRMERDGGYKAFLLNYRVVPNYYPLPQMDLALAVMYVRAHAQEYHIDPDRILIVGSSAGGHLCASEAYLHNEMKKQVLNTLADAEVSSATFEMYQKISARPDGVGLLYPVISFLSDYHEGSYLNLTDRQAGLRELLSVEQHITADYPPVYAFTNADDGCVPPNNTARLDQALSQASVTHLCQTYPAGDHGVGLGYHCSCNGWSEEMLTFFERVL